MARPARPGRAGRRSCAARRIFCFSAAREYAGAAGGASENVALDALPMRRNPHLCAGLIQREAATCGAGRAPAGAEA